MKNLTFRRQFVLTNKKVTPLEGWNILSLSFNQEIFYLHSHPDLKIFQAEGANLKLVLIGNIIDPFLPENDSEAVLKTRVSGETFDDVLKGSYTLGGRFIIIGTDHTGIKLFNDAMAFRQVFYIKSNGLVACGSTTSILANWFDLKQNQDKDFQEFYTSKAYNSQERTFIGSITAVKDVHHLMPNHYLDMQTLESHRFWPLLKEPRLSVHASINLMSEILTGTMKAVAGKYTIYQGLTSGWDTRMLLAASRNFIKDIHFFFLHGFEAGSEEKQNVDLKVAVDISEKMKLDFEAINLQSAVPDKNFMEIYYSNESLARPKLLRAYYYAYTHNQQDSLTISGTGGNEVLRTLRQVGQTDENSHRIAKMWHYESFPFITNTIDKWFKLNESIRKTNYRKIDLFFWEQMFANWGSLSGSEQDIVREELRPFNNRAFIAAYINLPLRYRYADNPLGHARIIQKLWPELMEYDMDIRYFKFKKVLRKLKLERAFAILYNDLKRLKK